MATTESPSARDPQSSSPEIKEGIAPLRAGKGNEFLLRRLHSLSGIVPVGAFLAEHILYSNAVATNGPAAYGAQVKFLGGLPFVTVVEFLFIWLPIAFHGLYGFWIWFRGTPNLVNYRYAGNWFYGLQRWTGMIAFAYIVWHTYTMRFTGIDLHAHPYASFGKVQHEVFQAGLFAFYVLGLVAASWHFAYGLWLFAVKWGLITGETARKRGFIAAFGVFVLMAGVGLASLRAFRSHPQQPFDEQGARQMEQAR